MNKIQILVAVAVAAVTLSMGGKAFAQPPGGGGGGFQNMDPQQIQKMMQDRILTSFREQMAVSNDTEWAVIAERITAVTQARMATMADGGAMGFGGGMRGGGGGGGGRFQGMFGQPSPESQALQQAIDAQAPASVLKPLIAKLEAVRKDKQAKLTKAQEDLRAVLSTRQEAIAVVGGLLN